MDAVRDFAGMQIDRYILSSTIGAGGGGTVYQAVEISTEASPALAIKVVRESIYPCRRDQQVAEIRNQNAVARCANVLQLLDVFQSEGYYFFVMPLCKIDMHQAIWKRRVYWKNDTLIKQVFMDVLNGVLGCHMNGIFHRDLKPENILCDANGTSVRIADFGLSTNHRVCDDGPCGTPAYIGPDCWVERGVYYFGDLADVWALGVILFNLVTSQFPWDEARPADKKFQAFLSDDDHLLRKYPISAPLNALLRQIWEPNPSRRVSVTEIQRKIMLMDTFYKPDFPSRNARSPLSKGVVPVDDTEPTRVVPVEEAKKPGALSRILMNVMDEGTFVFCPMIELET